ncbi:MAG: ATP-binding protein [Candidatus Omnitrophica bacterium]|nr:ATP-binding protein [Candidatus Omnitrophota bacterium]
MFASIKNKLLLLVVTFFCAGAFTIGIYSDFLMRRYLQASQQERIQTTVLFLSEEVDVFFSHKAELMSRILSGHEIEVFNVKAQPLMLQEYFSNFAEQFQAISLLGADGAELVRVHGRDISYDLRNFSETPLFKEAVSRRGELVVAPVEIDPGTELPTVKMMISHYSYFGDKLINVLYTEAPIEEISGLISRARISANGFASLVDKRGIILSHPRDSEILTKISAGSDTRSQDLLAAALALRSGRGRATLFGTDAFVGYAGLEKFGYSVLVIYPYIDFMKAPQALRANLLLCSLLLLVIGFLVTSLLGRYITLPLLELTAFSREIAKGDFSRRLKVRAQDETGELTQAFNKMVEDLRTVTVSRDDLEKEVEKRKQVEAILRQQEEYLKTIFDSVRTGILIVDYESHVIIDANSTLVEMAGVPKDRIIGSICHKFVCPAEEGKCPVSDLGGTVDNSERVFIRASGERIPVIKTVVSIILNGRKVLVENLSDISALKRAEAELKEAYNQLKATQAQLAQSSKMASLGLLAGGVAHEINNPLSGVLNNVQLVKMLATQQQDFRMEDFKKILDVIEESAERCKRIIRSLLDFSHASKGTFERVSLNEAVEKVAVLISREFQLEGITIQKALQPDLPLVMGEPQLLQQFIFDIFSNARWAILQKAAKEGGTITIETVDNPRENTVRLSITDTGIGMDEETINKIFDPFFTTKEVGQGTGLGLSIVYNIIKAHNGSIEVNSAKGAGTTFIVKMPAVHA